MRWICLADVTAPTMLGDGIFDVYGEISAENQKLV